MKTLFKSKAIGLLFLVLVACTAGYSQDTKVFVTDTGAKYHRETCRYLRLSKSELTLDSAKEKGYTACKVCKPVTTPSTLETEKTSVSPQTTTPTRSSSSTGTTRQCSAITQKGTRCKRTTTSSSGKCWQHE